VLQIQQFGKPKTVIVEVEFVKVKIRVFMRELIALIMLRGLRSQETIAGLLVANMILAVFVQDPKKGFGRG
jgi:hypothetical protein